MEEILRWPTVLYRSDTHNECTIGRRAESILFGATRHVWECDVVFSSIGILLTVRFSLSKARREIRPVSVECLCRGGGTSDTQVGPDENPFK